MIIHLKRVKKCWILQIWEKIENLSLHYNLCSFYARMYATILYLLYTHTHTYIYI